MQCQALVLAPTRELAQQIQKVNPPPPLTNQSYYYDALCWCVQVIIALGDYMDIQCHACIGGTNVRADLAKLEMGQHIVVGTPGRVHDMINRKALGKSSKTTIYCSNCRQY